MSELIFWKDREINRLRRDMDQVFQRCCRDLQVPFFPAMTPAVETVDLLETQDALVLTARLPGLRHEELILSVTDTSLTIQAERGGGTVHSGADYRRIDVHEGSFLQTIRLPKKVVVDGVEATFKGDLLTVVMPKQKPAKPERTRIRIE